MPNATGFLIAPALVLTCWHVAKFFWQPGYQYFCEFAAREGQQAPVPVPVERVLVSSHAAPAEHQDEDLLKPVGVLSYAMSQYLDFALLKLLTTADGGSAEGLPDGRALARGWLKLADQPIHRPAPASSNVAPRVQCQIIQHPDRVNGGAGQSATTGALCATWAEDGRDLRLCYDTPTKNGTSGSPVFGSDRTVIAMHQARLPEGAIAGIDKSLGQGVPMWMIVEAIKKEAQADSELAAAWAQKEKADAEWRRFKAQEERRLDDVPKVARLALNEIIIESMDRDAEKENIVRAFQGYTGSRNITFVQIMGRTNDDRIHSFIKKAMRLLLISTKQGGVVDEKFQYANIIENDFYQNLIYDEAKILKLKFPKESVIGGELEFFIEKLKERAAEINNGDGAPFICMAWAEYGQDDDLVPSVELMKEITASTARELSAAGVTPLPLVIVVQTLADDQSDLAEQHYDESWRHCRTSDAPLMRASMRLRAIRKGSLVPWLDNVDRILGDFIEYNPVTIRTIHHKIPDKLANMSQLFNEFKDPLHKILKLS